VEKPAEKSKGACRFRSGRWKVPGARLFHLLFGRRLRTTEAHTQKVTPCTGIPILGLDALGSASYGPEAALAVLIVLGATSAAYLRGVVCVILILLAILFFSYRQTIGAYPNGGGSYSVAKHNLGKGAGLVSGAALLLDYILNVAVGISAGVGALESAFPNLQEHRVALCLVLLTLVTGVNLRGVRDSGIAWTIPTYTFVLSMSCVLGIGIWKAIVSGGNPAPVENPPPLPEALGGVSAWLLIRAFSSGCTAMTGVEAVSNAVPIFAEPTIKNARRTLALICTMLALLLGGIAFLANAYHITAMSQSNPGYQSVISQLAGTVTGKGVLYYVTIGSLLAVLALSANTSFADFPRLCRLLADDSYLPSAFGNLGRRLVYTIGICVLATCAGVLLVAFDGITDHLIPLFAVGAFGAFTMSQAGMVAHWKKRGASITSPSLLINGFGAVTTAAALVVIIVAKFTHGAWITVVVIPAMIALFAGVRRHYARIKRETRPPVALQTWKVQPLQVVVPIDGWNRVTERALRFALRISSDITAIHVTPDESNDSLIEIWRERIEAPAAASNLPIPKLEIIHSPYRTVFDPVIEFVEMRRATNPDRLMAVVIPHLVEPNWWGYLLHNQLGAMLTARLLRDGARQIVVINTPWYLKDEDD
jgi:amino acid transporter